MADTYTFTVVVQDSGDEFSEEFNPKDPEQVRGFEEDIQDALRMNNWYCDSVTLTKVTTSL